MDPMTTRDTSLTPDRLARLREHLMTEITAGPATQSTYLPVAKARRAPRRLVSAGAAVVVTAAALLTALSMTGGPGGLGPTAFAVSHLPGDIVAIEVVNSDATAEQMTRQLHAQGLSVTVHAVPTNPQLVGTWVYESFSGDVPEAIRTSIAEQARDGYRNTVEIPASFPGTITLAVGRPMRAGETPQVAGVRNALAPGGLLFCTRLSGADPDAAAAHLRADGYTVHWSDGSPLRTIAAPPAGTRVTQAFIFDIDQKDVELPVGDPRDVTLVVVDPADSAFAKQLWTGYSASQHATGTADYSGCPIT